MNTAAVESDILIVKFSLQLLDLFNLPTSLHEVLLQNVVSISSDSEHASLSADVPHVCAIEVLADLGTGLVVYLTVFRDLLRVDLEDVKSRGFVGKRNLNLPVETTRSQESWVQSIRSIGSHHCLNHAEIIKTIELVE